MNYIFLLFCSIILPILSLKQTKPNLCINCKHFITDNRIGDEYGKCSLFPRENPSVLVNGINKDNNYYYCTTARIHDNLCGKEGKLYKKKYQKRITYVSKQ